MKHGMSRHPVYAVWQAMKQRCYNPRCKDYPNYGGRGIRVCKRWREEFSAFYLDMGVRPPGASLDRIDVNGGYEPDNCRWTYYDDQLANRRKASVECALIRALTGRELTRRQLYTHLGVYQGTRLKSEINDALIRLWRDGVITVVRRNLRNNPVYGI